MKLTRTQPGLMPSHPSAICSWNSCDVVMSMPSRRCPYGPAHEQPPRAWIPNRSFSSATTKLWCRYRPSCRTTNDTIDSRGRSWLPSTSIARVRLPSMQRAMREGLLALADRLGADRLLQLEDEAGADRIDDGRRAALLAVLDVAQVDVLERVHVRDRAAAGHARHGVVEQLPTRDQHARRPRPADELVRRQEDRVLVVEVGVRRPSRCGAISTSTYGAAAAKSQNDSAPWRCSSTEIARVSDRMPVTFDAAEKLPIFSGRSACSSSAASSAARSIRPSSSSGITTTSAIDSRHGSSFEWCSYGPMNTTGRSRLGDAIAKLDTAHRDRPGAAG